MVQPIFGQNHIGSLLLKRNCATKIYNMFLIKLFEFIVNTHTKSCWYEFEQHSNFFYLKEPTLSDFETQCVYKLGLTYRGRSEDTVSARALKKWINLPDERQGEYKYKESADKLPDLAGLLRGNITQFFFYIFFLNR